MNFRDKIADLLFPGLREEMYRQAIMLEANFDIYCLNLPAAPRIWEEAISCCESTYSDLQAGKITRKDRAGCLIEALKRKGMIRTSSAAVRSLDRPSEPLHVATVKKLD